MCPTRLGRPVEPEVSSQSRPASGDRGVAGGVVCGTPSTSRVTANPAARSSSRIVASTRVGTGEQQFGAVAGVVSGDGEGVGGSGGEDRAG